MKEAWPQSKTANIAMAAITRGSLDAKPQTSESEVEAIANMMDAPISPDIKTPAIPSTPVPGALSPEEVTNMIINRYVGDFIKQNGSYTPEMLNKTEEAPPKTKRVIID